MTSPSQEALRLSLYTVLKIWTQEKYKAEASNKMGRVDTEDTLTVLSK